MVDIVRILFPTDFSEPSAEAARYAFTLADRLRAELHALHVVEAIAPTLPEAAQRVAAFPDTYLAQARENAERALAASLPNDRAGGHKVVRAVRVGAPLGTFGVCRGEPGRLDRDGNIRTHWARAHAGR